MPSSLVPSALRVILLLAVVYPQLALSSRFLWENTHNAPAPAPLYSGDAPLAYPRTEPYQSPPPPPLSRSELDFMTEDVQRKGFSVSDFQFTFDATGDKTSFGTVKPEGVAQKPALATLPNQGVAQALVTLEACAINQPHTHPRGTEFAFITKGELLFGFIEENFNAKAMSGGRFLSQNVTVGTTFVIAQGLIHFALNRGCSEAQFLASFPTKDQGTQTTMTNLFSYQIPNDVLRATTGLSDHDIDNIKQKVAMNPNPSADPECLKRCGLNTYGKKL